MGCGIVNSGEMKLREEAIDYYNRCLLLGIKCIFNNYEIYYDYANDKLKLISLLEETEIIDVINIFDEVCSNCLPLHNNVTKEIYFGDKLNLVAVLAFRGNYTLNKVVFKTLERLVIEEQAFIDCYLLSDIIAENLVSIGDEAFYNCTSLKNINLSHVEEIGYECFYKCSSLVYLKLNSIKTLGYGSFKYCYNIKDVYIGEYLKVLEDETFLGCNTYTVKIDSLCTSFNFTAFDACTNLYLKYKDKILEIANGYSGDLNLV